MPAGEGEITTLLNEAARGNRAAEALLLESIYAELHRLASWQMGNERHDHTLQPTALLNEAYLRLFKERNRTWENRSHFLGVAAHVMRTFLIDYARRRASAKQGGGAVKLPLSDVDGSISPTSVELIALDTALNKLSSWDPRQVRIVELRFFAGLTEDQIASVLDLSPRTVKREWAFAKAWLQKELGDGT